ncbi:MAG TPA: 50S ribosomal protein L21 [Clostridia bacterium]|nr:50S ribosomal protein L21 [Clostridia bacterium]
MYAIIETGGKQYMVREGDVLVVEKLNYPEGEVISFDKVLVVSKEDGNVEFGKPYLENVKVNAKVLEHGKGPKIRVFKYKPKKNYRKRQGHRQPYTKIQIENIVK